MDCVGDTYYKRLGSFPLKLDSGAAEFGCI